MLSHFIARCMRPRPLGHYVQEISTLVRRFLGMGISVIVWFLAARYC